MLASRARNIFAAVAKQVIQVDPPSASLISTELASNSRSVMPAPPVIVDLIERFEQQGDAYKSGQYNEAQLRKEFIDPMFKALGWDMENVSGYAEAYKDVIHEDAIKIGGATKAKRGTAEVDDAFLSEIEQWRADLARNLALRNPKLSQRDLNFSVQRTLRRSK